MTRILLPVDGSGNTDRALAYVVGRHGRGTVTVSLIYVHEPPILSHGVTIGLSLTSLAAFRAQRARDVLEASAAALRAAGIEVETSEVEGPLYRSIKGEASRWGADEIVLGVRPPLFGFRRLDREKGLRRVAGGFPAYVTVAR